MFKLAITLAAIVVACNGSKLLNYNSDKTYLEEKNSQDVRLRYETRAGGAPVDGPPVDGPPAGGPPAKGPSTEGRSTEGPSTEGPSTEGPSTEGPSTEGPSTEGPSTEGPSTEGPSTEGPSTEGPSTEGPPAEGPEPEDQEEDIDTNLYYVYTRQNRQVPINVLATEDSINRSPILLSRRTIILVHGHGGSHTTSLNPDVKDALLTAEDLNVIVVDWSVFASLRYSVAVGTVPYVSERLVVFIRLLVNTGRVKLNELHLVGFNLGAHVVGIAGRTLNGAVARITGLDPSGKEWGSSSPRLRITDARYVEVIHTDGSGLRANGIGIALGNVDFFANGGSNQPGCLSHACCHNRAFQLFAASMVNPSLVGYPCATNAQLTFNRCRGLPLRMGGTLLNKTGAGVYRINTRRNYPF